MSTAGSDIPPRGSVGAAGNRRSQGFTEKTKANSHLNKGRTHVTHVDLGLCACMWMCEIAPKNSDAAAVLIVLW